MDSLYNELASFLMGDLVLLERGCEPLIEESVTIEFSLQVALFFLALQL